MTSGGSRGPRRPSFTTYMTDAASYPVGDPLRLLALAVIMRWQQDGAADDIGTEWADAAELPDGWFARLDQRVLA